MAREYSLERYRKLGGTKPIVITEFGPAGTWETPKNEWGKVPEPTSTQKAEMYRRAYQANVIDHADLCLGAYAFTWGAKQEMTLLLLPLALPGPRRRKVASSSASRGDRRRRSACR